MRLTRAAASNSFSSVSQPIKAKHFPHTGSGETGSGKYLRRHEHGDPSGGQSVRLLKRKKNTPDSSPFGRDLRARSGPVGVCVRSPGDSHTGGGEGPRRPRPPPSPPGSVCLRCSAGINNNVLKPVRLTLVVQMKVRKRNHIVALL